MPVQLWGTFSVADHLDTRALVADVLLYDRLIIPCPPPSDQEYERWIKKGWKPKTQAHVLRMIEGLYEPVFWDEERQERFRQIKNSEPTLSDIAGRARMELNSLELARRMLREEFELFATTEMLPEGAAANDIRIVNAYRSAKAFRREFVISNPLQAKQPVPSVDEESEEEELVELEDEVPPDRETEMYRLVSRELALPDDKDPEVALQRAVELAKSEAYQRHRRRLYDYIDGRMARNASRYSDRRAIEDQIAEMSELERNEFKSNCVEFANVFGKAFVSAMAWELPGIASGLMEFVGYLTKSEGNAPDGPFAMFHDVKKMFRKHL